MPYTKEQIENRTSDYICWDCGNEFKTPEQLTRESVVTQHTENCGLCGEEKPVTHIRAFNYLNYPPEKTNKNEKDITTNADSNSN